MYFLRYFDRFFSQFGSQLYHGCGILGTCTTEYKTVTACCWFPHLHKLCVSSRDSPSFVCKMVWCSVFFFNSSQHSLGWQCSLTQLRSGSSEEAPTSTPCVAWRHDLRLCDDSNSYTGPVAGLLPHVSQAQVPLWRCPSRKKAYVLGSSENDLHCKHRNWTQ